MLGRDTLPVFKKLVLAAGKRPYGVIARGAVTIRGSGGPIVEPSFCHFDDFEKKLVIRRFDVAAGRHTIEVKGVNKSAPVVVDVGTKAQDVELVVR